MYPRYHKLVILKQNFAIVAVMNKKKIVLPHLVLNNILNVTESLGT